MIDHLVLSDAATLAAGADLSGSKASRTVSIHDKPFVANCLSMMSLIARRRSHAWGLWRPRARRSRGHADHIIVLKNAGPKGGPGMPEWGMLPIPKKLVQAGVRDMVRISDGRMSGTSYGACTASPFCR